MRLRLGAAIASAVTMGIGFVTILGLLIGNDLGELSRMADRVSLREVADVFLQLVVITVALTIIIGVVNLLGVHLSRVVGRRRGAIYSLVLIASFALVVGLYITKRDTSMVLLETVQISIESALAGLLFFALVYGAYRMMHRRVTWSGILFIVALLIVLVGALPFSDLDAVSDARDWLLRIPVSAGARGILIGIALATVVTGVRVLIGQDRSYRE